MLWEKVAVVWKVEGYQQIPMLIAAPSEDLEGFLYVIGSHEAFIGSFHLTGSFRSFFGSSEIVENVKLSLESKAFKGSRKLSLDVIDMC